MDQLTVLRKLQETLGYIGIGKLYSLGYKLYKWAHLAEDCAIVVRTCLGC